MRILGLLLLAGAAGLVACKREAGAPSGSVVLYDVDFSAPGNAVGAPPALADANAAPGVPRRGPSDIFMGAPKVVDALCGLTNQPVRLSVASGTQGHEGLFFALGGFYGHYRVELDLCVQNLGAPPMPANEPQLAIFVDLPQAYALGFFAGGRLVMIDQARGADVFANPAVIGSYAVGQPIHVAIDVDVPGETWKIAADGKELYSGKTGPVVPSAIRVVTRGNANNEAAIDNIVVWAENDLSESETDPLASETAPEESAEVPK
jgi:hypothetical protein